MKPKKIPSRGRRYQYAMIHGQLSRTLDGKSWEAVKGRVGRKSVSELAKDWDKTPRDFTPPAPAVYSMPGMIMPLPRDERLKRRRMPVLYDALARAIAWRKGHVFRTSEEVRMFLAQDIAMLLYDSDPSFPYQKFLQDCQI